MQRTLGGKQNEVEVARVAHTCRLLACVRFHVARASRPRVALTSRLAGPLRSQDRPCIGRGDPSADGLRVFVGRPDASGRRPRRRQTFNTHRWRRRSRVTGAAKHNTTSWSPRPTAAPI